MATTFSACLMLYIPFAVRMPGDLENVFLSQICKISNKDEKLVRDVFALSGASSVCESQTEEDAERAKRFPLISRLCLIF